MNKTVFGAAITALVMVAAPALAQTVGLGSTTRGGTSQIGKSISAVISEVSKLQMRPQEMANTADYMPLVNAGQIEFGIANQVQTWFAYNGKGMSEGKPMKNLRIASVLMPFPRGLDCSPQLRHYIHERDEGQEDAPVQVGHTW